METLAQPTGIPSVEEVEAAEDALVDIFFNRP
jgi:hypothetical protein